MIENLPQVKVLSINSVEDEKKDIGNIENKWTMPIQNWGMILQQFLIKFEDRCRI